MRTCLAWFVLFSACFAQSPTSEEHIRGMEQNPPGVRFVIATVDGRSTYHVSDKILFKFSFTSKASKSYTVELATGQNAAGASDDFVIQGPGVEAGIHSGGFPPAIVCCESDRRYLGEKPHSATVGFDLKWVERLLNPRFPLSTSYVHLQPGEYMIFVQTRRVMRGWPKSEQERYHAVSNILVTSSNILHIKILADAEWE